MLMDCRAPVRIVSMPSIVIDTVDSHHRVGPLLTMQGRIWKDREVTDAVIGKFKLLPPKGGTWIYRIHAVYVRSQAAVLD
jgi:hypothetical protein